MSHLRPSAPRRGARVWVARSALVWLVLALAWVPTLGRLHQIAHAQPLAQIHAGHAAQAMATAVADAVPHAHSQTLLGGFLSGHSRADCLLLDQLALGDALQAAVPVPLPSLPAAAPQVRHAERIHARHAALFQARGPPPMLRG